MRARRWRYLLNLIEHLPRASFFVEAVADDDEAFAGVDELPADRPERLSEWTPEVAMQAQILDRIGSLIEALVAVNGGNPPTIKPHPRPVTAWERIKRRRIREHHESFVARMKGRGEP